LNEELHPSGKEQLHAQTAEGPHSPAQEEPHAAAAEAADGDSRTSRTKILKNLTTASPFVVSAIAVLISLLAYLDQHSTNEAARISSEQIYATNSSFWLVDKPSTSRSSAGQDSTARQQFQQAVAAAQAAGLASGKSKVIVTFGPISPAEAEQIAGKSTSVEVIEIPAINVDTSVEAEIENRNSTPISNVDLIVRAQAGLGKVLSTEAVRVGTVPPCSIAAVNTISSTMTSITNQLLDNALAHSVNYNEITIDISSMVFTDSNGMRWMRSQNGELTEDASAINDPSSIEYPDQITTAPGC
jgi:hypothetical protein